jgi:hypothetical protein
MPPLPPPAPSITLCSGPRDLDAASDAVMFQLSGNGYQPLDGTVLVGLPAVVAPEVADVLAGPHGATAELLQTSALAVTGVETNDEPLSGAAGAAVATVRRVCCVCPRARVHGYMGAWMHGDTWVRECVIAFVHVRCCGERVAGGGDVRSSIGCGRCGQR